MSTPISCNTIMGVSIRESKLDKESKVDAQSMGLRAPIIKDLYADKVELIWSTPAFAANFARVRPDLSWRLSLQCDMGKGTSCDFT